MLPLLSAYVKKLVINIYSVLMCRHVKLSLDMLLKLVAVFGPTIRATVSAPPSVGVDLHQEERWHPFSQIILFTFSCILYVNEANLYEISRTGGNAATSALWNYKRSKWLFQYWYGNHAVFNVAFLTNYVNWKQFCRIIVFNIENKGRLLLVSISEFWKSNWHWK